MGHQQYASPDIGQAGYIQGAAQQGRSSFLKKRSKKLLPVSSGGPTGCRPHVQRGKSFLLIFSKKNTFFSC
jgi:hypothetical protein